MFLSVVFLWSGFVAIDSLTVFFHTIICVSLCCLTDEVEDSYGVRTPMGVEHMLVIWSCIRNEVLRE